MPKVGLTMTEGTIVHWHKREGDRVRKGEPLFTFETEKSTLDYEAPASGTLSRILVAEGCTVPCLTPVALLEDIVDAGERSEAPVRRPCSPRARMHFLKSFLIVAALHERLDTFNTCSELIGFFVMMYSRTAQ